jgi:hypothetical protein
MKTLAALQTIVELCKRERVKSSQNKVMTG